MNTKTEGTMAVTAAVIVLFSAFWDARISVAVSAMAFLALGIDKFVHISAE